MSLPLNLRVREANQAPVRQDRSFVLYWMIATRRAVHNFALDRAVDWASRLQLPLVVFEALRVGYPCASDRLHRFVIEGMRDNAAAFARTPAVYYPYVEPEPGNGSGLLEALAARAALVVTDDFPCFFLPHMVTSAAARLAVRVEAVDSNGLLPVRLAQRAYPAAVHFRRHVQKHIRVALKEGPRESPFGEQPLRRLSTLDVSVTSRWPSAAQALLDGSDAALARLPIDHSVQPVSMRGGSVAAAERLDRFLSYVGSYHEDHNHPDADRSSRLSPYLHFGHISPHEIFARVVRRERWSLSRLGTVNGAREGFWGLSQGAEAFLDQLLTWRELALNTCTYRPDDYDTFAGLPGWAQETLLAHATDKRSFVYTEQEFAAATTHDPLWNAAQRQLREEGWMHNYLRMLWGKKILEWSAGPEEALGIMRRIMDRWALDGRDPNSYAGYAWTLGRYDRPWPERAIYGSVRSMSSVNTRKKVRVEALLNRYGDGTGPSRQGALLD